jgi:NarL family two-component system response regulator YdfI
MAKRNGAGVRRVLVAAGSSVRRAGLEAIVRANSTLKLAGSVPSAAMLAAQACELEPDVVLADLDRPDPQFLSALSAWSQTGSAAPVIALIDNPDPGWVSRALRTGIRAILPRDAPVDEILSAIRAACAGLVLLDPEVTQELARHVQAENRDSAPVLDELTHREIEVLRMLAQGLGNKQMAARLGISEHTVKFHVSSILAKLGASSRTEAVTLGIRTGLILL